MQAEYNRRPWGEIRRDKMFGKVCQTMLLPHLKEGAAIPEPETFCPYIEAPQVTEAQVAAKLEAMMGAICQPSER